mmetsp:Transcript_5080/g.5871  ORF Transcript_5080/g.5871 Transcript_5080/m.5871 type:complete len:243 (+) Transcript_5080:212-940(+)|eukprot:CAMPEP_0184057256 /NCGR_PEP_ID=MMETSP0956-20121227/8333_1 /TAXON_ID=627963 /ORGANISM="Aplanochytrium sp, Strain PBS07" /LENGTH=242 /DNA_ID=CAMNT_0026351575 /DNA_START=160 /DNA_END=888 /DNA_ORIENTATION=+
MGSSRWAQWVSAVGPRLTRLKRTDLFDFSSRSSVEMFEDWHVWTDKGYGGKSTATFQPKFTSLVSDKEWKASLKESKSSEGKDVTTMESNAAVFSGTLSTVNTRADVARTGFAAARAHLPWYVQDVSDFEGLSIRFKSDGRRYNINITPESFFSDDLYQGFLLVGPEHKDKWVTASLPFENLLLTGNGRIKEYQRALDHSELRSIGVSIADNEEGDFKLEIEWIRAVGGEELEHYRRGRSPS